VLLIDVLTGLGGASQEDQQPAIFIFVVLDAVASKWLLHFSLVRGEFVTSEDLIVLRDLSRESAHRYLSGAFHRRPKMLLPSAVEIFCA